MTIYGWDMSHFDAPGVGGAVADGISFLTHKAGGDKPDAEIGAWWQGVRGLDPARVLLGAYWVLRPDLSGSASAKADAFLARLDAVCPGWRLRPFLLQVDCERWNGDGATVPSKVYIQAFCDRLVRECPKLTPIVYAPKWVYGDRLTGLGYPLWASSYVDGSGPFKRLYPGDGSDRWNAYSGQVPAILQYSSSAVIGGQSTSDANAYRGTLAQLQALVAPGWEDDMPLTGDDAKTVLEADLIPIGGGALGAGTDGTWVFGATVGRIYDDAHATAAAVKTLVDRPQLDPAGLASAVAGQVLAGLKGASAQETAAALAVVLGDQAAEVGRILAGA